MIHAFAFPDKLDQIERYFLLDVESGAIHGLDRAAFLVAKALEEGGDPYAAATDAGLVEEILAELAELEQDGLFNSPELPIPQRQDAPVIKSLCLHVAHDCNLRCKYCFGDTGEYHGARMLMPLEVGKAALEFLMAHSGRRHNLEVDLFGGEPLMNFEVVKGIVAYGRELEKRHGKSIHFTITTNGLALDEEKIAYINAEMHNVVLSIDGRKAVHDALRPTANGKGSYDLVLPRIQALVRARGGKEHYVRGTFTRENLDFTKDVCALRDAGFEQISVEPVVLTGDSPFAIREEDLPRILEEYDTLAAFLRESKQVGKWFNFFHFMLDLEDGPCLQKRVKGCGAGVEYAAVSPEGDLYPCHQFVGQPDYCFGNVLKKEYSGALSEVFRGCTIRTKPACRGCWAKYYCSGGCAANAYTFHGDIMQPEALSCALLRKRTECAIALAMLEKEEASGQTT